MTRFWTGLVIVLLALPVLAAKSDPGQLRLALAASALAQQIVADPAVRVLKGKTLAITRFANRSESTTVDVQSVQERVTAAVVKARWFTVVERERLDRALAEIKLNADGLTDPATRTQLGKLLGADLLLLGSITGDTDSETFQARLVTVETGVVVATAIFPPPGSEAPERPTATPPPAETTEDEDQITLVSWSSSEFNVSSTAWDRATAKRDAVRWLVEAQVLKEAQDVLDTWRPEIEKRIYAKADSFVLEITPRDDAYYLRLNATQIMRELVSIIFGKVTPRVMLATREQILQRPAPDPAVATALAGILLQYGFQVVDSEQTQAVLLREAMLQGESGDDRAQKLVRQYGGELPADIVALGDSVAEGRPGRDGYDGRIEVRLVETATGRLLASVEDSLTVTRAEEPKLDPASLVMGKKTLQRGAERVAVRMVGAMLKAFGTPVYRLRVWKIGSFDAREKILDGLRDTLGGAVVTPVSLDLRGTNCAVFTVSTKRDADAVARALRDLTDVKVKITDVTCRSLTAEVQ
jgi:TolB-like protein